MIFASRDRPRAAWDDIGKKGFKPVEFVCVTGVILAPEGVRGKFPEGFWKSLWGTSTAKADSQVAENRSAEALRHPGCLQ